MWTGFSDMWKWLWYTNTNLDRRQRWTENSAVLGQMQTLRGQPLLLDDHCTTDNNTEDNTTTTSSVLFEAVRSKLHYSLNSWSGKFKQ